MESLRIMLPWNRENMCRSRTFFDTSNLFLVWHVDCVLPFWVDLVMDANNDESWRIDENLADGLVLFTSDEGKIVFFESYAAGYLNGYFKLASQFLTSFEPHYGCGLATLTMVLNTFGVDPGRVWKDIYRWYAEIMLEHCVPYNIIEKHGLAFQQFACMTDCNYLDVDLVCCAEDSASVEEFREICKRTTSGHCDQILVCCYDRVSLNQVGTGHFSPIGGYHPHRDLVLVFDISRYKYPLHWVPVESLWKAMKPKDVLTGHARGYFVLQKRTESKKPSLLFKSVSPLDPKTPHKGWLHFLNTVLLPWHHWMNDLETNRTNQSLFLGNVVNKLLEFLLKGHCSGNTHLDGVHMHLEFQHVDPSLDKECIVCRLRETIETNSLYTYVKDRIPKHAELCACWEKHVGRVLHDDKPPEIKCCQIKIQPSACHLRHFTLVHFVVMILLSWPYEMERTENYRKPSTVCSAMETMVATELSNSDNVLKEEVENTRRRFLTVR